VKTRHQRQYLPAIGTAKAVSCPVCGAAPGFRCVSRSLTRRLVVLEKKPTPDGNDDYTYLADGEPPLAKNWAF